MVVSRRENFLFNSFIFIGGVYCGNLLGNGQIIAGSIMAFILGAAVFNFNFTLVNYRERKYRKWVEMVYGDYIFKNEEE